MGGVAQRMSEFKELARALGTATDEDARLELTVNAAVSLADACAHAGFTVNDAGGLFTRASSDPW